MITRAQAEALLTLAESLEACERLGLEVSRDNEAFFVGKLGHWGEFLYRRQLTGMSLRLAVGKLIPKQET